MIKRYGPLEFEDDGTEIRIDTADVAKLIRYRLKQVFPGIVFSVKTRRYAGGSSIDVRWGDGPSTREVDNEVGHYHGKDFDGMTDSSAYRTHYIDECGYIHLAGRDGSGTTLINIRRPQPPNSRPCRLANGYIHIERERL